MNLTFEAFISDRPTQVYISMALTFLITLRAIPIIITICNTTGIMDLPIKRSSHANPTPTFGGVAIFAGMMIGYFMWNFGDEGNLVHRVIAGIIILFFTGIKDDMYGLSATKKFIVQIIASAIIVIGSDLRITDFFGILGIYSIPYVLSVLLTIIIFVAVINAYNLIDGADGLSGGVGMIASLAFGWWFLQNEFWSLACLALTLSASLAAFLRFNFSKTSKIFMGDTGSLILGFLITVFAVKFVHFNVNNSFLPDSHFVSAPIIVLSLLSVPLFDTIRVFGHRILRGKSPFVADRNHMHHLLLDVGLSHAQVAMSAYAFTIVFTLTTYFARSAFSNTQLMFYILGVFLIYIIVGYLLEVKRFDVVKSRRKQKNQQIASQKKDDVDLSENNLQRIAKSIKN